MKQAGGQTDERTAPYIYRAYVQLICDGTHEHEH